MTTFHDFAAVVMKRRPETAPPEQLVGPRITAMPAHDSSGRLLPPMVGGAPKPKRKVKI